MGVDLIGYVKGIKYGYKCIDLLVHRVIRLHVSVMVQHNTQPVGRNVYWFYPSNAPSREAQWTADLAKRNTKAHVKIVMKNLREDGGGIFLGTLNT
jgi:hypothetical protein